MSVPMVKVRIAVCVGADGSWHSCGFDGGDPEDMHGIAADGMETDAFAEYWVEAVLPIPARATVQGGVTKA